MREKIGEKKKQNKHKKPNIKQMKPKKTKISWVEIIQFNMTANEDRTTIIIRIKEYTK